MRKLTQLLLAGLLLLALMAAPSAQADTSKPRELQASACTSVKVAERGHVLYRRGVSCSYAKRWVRRLAATGGDSKPRGWSCSSGSGFRSGGYCEKGLKHFGWYRGQ